MAEQRPPENAEETTEAQAPASAPAAHSAAPEPQEVLAPKQRRQRARQSKASETKAGATRTPEERQADRIVERRQKAHARREGRAKAKAKARASSTGASVTPPRRRCARAWSSPTRPTRRSPSASTPRAVTGATRRSSGPRRRCTLTTRPS